MYFVLGTNLQQDEYLRLPCFSFPCGLSPSSPFLTPSLDEEAEKRVLNCRQETWIRSPIDPVTLGGHLASGALVCLL